MSKKSKNFYSTWKLRAFHFKEKKKQMNTDIRFTFLCNWLFIRSEIKRSSSDLLYFCISLK